MDGRTVTIVVPAYNEEGRIGAMLDAYLSAFGRSVLIDVIVNGCRDKTRAVVERYAKAHADRLTYLDIPQAVGKGGAVLAGYQRAATPLVGFVDADGATSSEEFAKLIRRMDDASIDGVIASRWLPNSVVRARLSWRRKAATSGFRFIVKALFGLPFEDTQCGAKLFRLPVIQAVAPSVRTMNMAFDVEFLVRAQHKGFCIVEESTVWVDQEESARLGSFKAFLSESMRMFGALLRIRFFR